MSNKVIVNETLNNYGPEIDILDENCQMVIYTTDDLICSICDHNEVQVIFIPCGHYMSCVECSNFMKGDLCPYCRRIILLKNVKSAKADSTFIFRKLLIENNEIHEYRKILIEEFDSFMEIERIKISMELENFYKKITYTRTLKPNVLKNMKKKVRNGMCPLC